METKRDKIKNFTSGLVFGLVIITAMLALTGCPDGEKNNAARTPYGGYGNYGPYGYGGPGYGGYGAVSNIAMGFETMGRASMILEVATDQAGAYGYGAAWVRGEIQVMQPIVCNTGMMGLNPGPYQLMPMNNSPAMFDVDFLSGVTLIAQGPGGQAIIGIPYAKFFQTNVCGFEGLMAAVDIQQVNGVPCSTQISVSDMAAGGTCW